MNMKKTIGICATLLAALLCAVPQSAQATGKIRTVDVYDPDGLHSFPNAGSALTVGDKIRVRFRMVNVQWANTVADPSYTNPWEFMYTGSLTGNVDIDELLRQLANKPRLGLWISGRVCEAECVNWPMGDASDWVADRLDGEQHYTDLIFEYTVQAGDLALPVMLANESGTGPAVGEEKYYLRCNGLDTLWKMVDQKTHSVTNDFAFGPQNLNDDPDFAGQDLTKWNRVSSETYENRDLDLSGAGVYVQAIDFDTTYFKESEGVWRSIAQGSTTADPGTPTIAIAGGAARPMDLYLWTDSNTVAEVVAGGQVVSVEEYPFGDGVIRKVGKVHITTGDEGVPFSIKATGDVGAATKVFLAATPTNIYNAANDLVTNFITRTVQVGEPLPPGINVTVNGKAKDTVTANADYATALVGVNVTLSEAYPGGELTIPIKVSVKDKPALDAHDYVGMSLSSVDDNTAWDAVLTIPSGQTSANQSLWLYANRGTVDTENNGLLVEVDTNAMDSAARAFFTGKILPATVVVNRSTPEITADLSPITAEANSPQEITINVRDAYGEMRDPCRYTVYWSNSGNDSAAYYTKITNLTASAAGDLTFSVTYPTKSGENPYPSMFYVVNEDGKSSTKRTVAVTVTAQKVIEVALVDRKTKFPENALDEQAIATLSFGEEGFVMPNGAQFGYIFLVPRDENSSNLVDSVTFGDDWKKGLLVFSGDQTTEPLMMTLLDGSRGGTAMGYDIIVRTEQNWDDGDLVSTWNSRGLSFAVTNVAPAVTPVVVMGGMEINPGDVAGASLGVPKTFMAYTDEPADLDLYADDPAYTDQNQAFTTRWEFKLGNSTVVTNVYGPPDRAFSYAFMQAGQWTVKVKMRDKDMDHARNQWGPEFTFTVNVDAKPSITLAPYTGLDQFYESSIGRTYGRINVGLSMAPSAPITVHLEVTRAGTDNGNYPLPVLDSYDVNFGGTSGVDGKYVYFTWLDGTPLGGSSGFTITATVTNTTQNADGVAWSELYTPATLPVTIVNEAPQIVTDPGTNEVRKAENEPFRIPYTVKDVPADMASPGLTVTWSTSEGFTTNYQISATGVGQYVVYNGQSPMFSFMSAGSKTVTLLLEDKDGDYDQKTWKYYVLPSKAVLIYPRQPGQLDGRGGSISSFSAYYTGAAGIGDGRVWADGSVVEFNNFVHKYTFDPTVPSANVYARGYKVGDVDNGTLQPGTDIVIDANGNHYKSGGYSSYYTSRELKNLDSFFYCWIMNASGERGGGFTGELLNNTFLPAVESKGRNTANGQQLVTLPEYEKDLESYPATVLEAIFSKELLPSDNVGDINQDGIPDVFAVNYTFSGGKLFEFANGGAEGAGGDTGAAATDIKPKITAFNGDGDYLPPATMTGGGIPSTANGWSNVGQPFTAKLEIRGFDEHLNYRVANDGLNYRVRGAWVSDPAFSPAESNAIVYMNKKLNIHEFAWPFDATNAEHVANWNQGLNKDDCWIPENRTDPTVDDTDEDGFPDGFEYYFWYMSTVGWIDGEGEWKRLEGERFQLEDIAKGVPISSDDVALAFNPTVAATGSDLDKRDTDNDGLTDLEELALGTNPVHWDTDGDGMSDLWEIMRGKNPLKAPDPTKRETNLDGDFMASFTTEKTYAIAKFTTAEGATVFYALPDNGGSVLSELQNGDQGDDQSDDDPVAGDDTEQGGLSNITAIAVYRYGGTGTDYTPVSRGSYGKDESVSYLSKAGTKFAGRVEGDIRITTSKPLDMAEVDISEMTFVSFETNKALHLVHDQVYAQFGFDPRTAWGMNVNGYVCNRWDPHMNPNYAPNVGEAGLAVNTSPYSDLDEYLVLKYRYNAQSADEGEAIRSLSGDLSKIAANELTIADVLAAGTTNPNVPFEEVDYTVTGAPSSGEESTDTQQQGATVPTYTSTNHGADTDEDGVPDGWELYVMFNPNDKQDRIVEVDGDDLPLGSEYAGTDSCNAYEHATNGVGLVTIYENHPGNKSGWFNKFFPTDPWDIDTDGDGISDRDEGISWTAAFKFGDYSTSHTFTFIYGEPTDDNRGLLCIRGGGLNPCTVDTDGDLLPDPWERDFAGVVFKGGSPVSIGLPSGELTAINRNDGIVGGGEAYYITAGMDGTFGPRNGEGGSIVSDAATGTRDPRTGTVRNFDFDNDGLQNFQEYLVQTLRHLRYDDTETPLMGSYLPDGLAGTRTYVGFLPMQTWDGAAFFKTARAAGFTGLSAYGGEGFRYRDLGYFIRPPKPWDVVAQDEVGINVCANYEEPGYRVMLRPAGLSPNAAAGKEDRIPARSYATTDPRVRDSDNDGMDDYYELFHGLNPLLGKGDVISDAYGVSYDGILFSAYFNAWVGWPTFPPMMEPVYDAMKYPWFMGTAEADADGDGLRNTEEALLVNTPSPQNYHTDPTPLWMTDSSAKTSFTAQYYGRDPVVTAAMGIPDLTQYFWFGNIVDSLAPVGSVSDYMFSFEENEGFDTDHDWLPDGQELTHAVTSATDPRNGDDPDRRQAMYFPGENSAVASYSGAFSRPVGENYAMLRKFTVEAWVRPDGAAQEQTVVTRLSDYPNSTLSNALHQVRANFRIALDAEGRVFGQFDSSDAVVSGSPNGFGTVTVRGSVLDAATWSHVALSYNGSALVLYVNGREVNRVGSNLIPANGIVLTDQSVTPSGANFGESGYKTYPGVFLVGADAANVAAAVLNDKSSWANYRAFYKGWVDEVRVWDGDRTAKQIEDDYEKRYSFADVAALREDVYASWLKGATRNENDGKPDLPAELVLHYSFQQLPSEVNSDYVASEPSGFTEKVVDNVKWNEHGVDLRCGWWSVIPIASGVYANRARVPWIRNTCGMLPAMDGSTPDSRYWSELLGGVTIPQEVNVASFMFPNTSCPYPYWNYMAEGPYRQIVLERLQATVSGNHSTNVVNLVNRFLFDDRTGFVGGADLLPLGDAFAKRCPDFWDGQGATDASTATADDLDNDGLPDWWEDYAAEYYGVDLSALTASTMVDYILPSGVTVRIPAWQAYQIDLARGMLPGGVYDDAYSTMDVDDNGDGIPDWWQKMFGVFDSDAADDSDGDGLSNYQEWLITWGDDYGYGLSNGFPYLDPTKMCSQSEQGINIVDYFAQSESPDYDGYYMGEIFTDHDFMEDLWEDAYNMDAVSRNRYDAHLDPDGDGWSNFAEMRSFTAPDKTATLSLVRADGSEDHALPAYPIPTVRATVANNSGEAFHSAIVVKAWKGATMSGSADATWSVAGDGEPSAWNSRFLGLAPNRKMKFNIGPGNISEHHVMLEFYDPNYYIETITYETNGTIKKVVYTPHNVDSADWGIFYYGDDPADVSNGRGTGALPGGWVNYANGDIEVDFASSTYRNTDAIRILESGDNQEVIYHYDLTRAFWRVRWMARLVEVGSVKKFSLCEAEEGYLREGKNTFVAFADLNGNGELDVGEPSGFARDVNVGFDCVNVEIALSSDAVAFDIPAQENEEATDKTLVRVVRTAINGVSTRQRIVYSRTIDLTKGKTFTEADFVKSGEYDLDWNRLVSDADALANVTADKISTVDYEVYVGENGTNRLATFTRHFAGSQSSPRPTGACTNSGYVVSSAQPVLKWKPGVGYSAFTLQIATDEDFTDIVYTTTNFMPAVMVDGCTFKPDVYVGDGLEDKTTYYWRVAQLNAKFRENKWSEAASFRTDIDSTISETGYGRLAAEVRYFGPAWADLSDVVVGVYEAADFASAPVARKRLTGSICDSTATLTGDTSKPFFEVTANVTFDGIAPGSYYVMAFIDTNGNGIRDLWESWGYACGIGTDVTDRWSPVSFGVSSSKVAPSAALVVMEDTDVNQNWMPDCLEDMSGWVSPTDGGGSSVSDSDEDGLSDDLEVEFGTDADNWDSDGDGMPDGWEAVFAETDPIVADAEEVAANDVMAYAVTNLTVVTTWNGLDEATATNKYVVADSARKVKIGDDAAALADVLARSYDYAGKYGLGKAAAATELAGLKVYMVEESAEVVLVHAQVYEFFGYSPYTANPAVAEADAVNTKTFTPLDKYLVCRYLEQAYGLADEVAMNTNGLWSAYTLKPGDADNDKDGVPDGWELYVMFGTGGVTATLPDALISPFNYDDARALAPAAGSELTLLEEFDGGRTPSDPWQTETAELELDGLTDAEAYAYHIKAIDDQLADEDNDGLSNWAEFLAAQLTGLDFKVDDPYSVDPSRLDYFVQVAQDGVTKYVGECVDADGLGLIADHDFMEDLWEDMFSVDAVNRYRYDSHLDLDLDGWSNWSEVRALTAPDRSATLSLVRADGAEDHTLPAYPIPTIRAKVSNSSGDSLDSAIVVKAWRGTSVAGPADATWTVTGSGEPSAWNSRFLGLAPNRKMKFNIGPGDISEHHVKLEFYDPNYYIETINYETNGTIKSREVTLHNVDTSDWGIFYYGDDPADDSNGRETGALPGGWVNYVNGDIVVDFTDPTYRNTDAIHVLKAGKDQDIVYHYDLTRAFWRASWMARLVGVGSVKTFSLSEASEGYLREGKNTFVAFADVNGNGELDVGEPSGFVRDVNVGFDCVNLEIALSSDALAFSIPAMESEDGSSKTLVRVMRTAINGVETKPRVIYSRMLDLTKGKTFTEADFVKSDEYGLDWNRLATDAAVLAGIAPDAITSADYAVYVGADGTNVIETFSRTFAGTPLAPTPCGACSNANYLVASAQPVLSWKADDGYSAFALQIAKDADFSDIVYTTTNMMPALADDGCKFKPEVYVGEELEDQTVYYWRVAQLNAKFTENEWSETATFRTSVNSTNADTGYGRLTAEVRYFGPVEATLADVVVGVYETADFASAPVARKRLGGSESVSTLTGNPDDPFLTVNTNVVFDGIAPGSYYVMAFIDTNTNGVREAYESWGYACGIGTDVSDRWAPVSFGVSSAKVDPPAALVVMEDTDVNQNGDVDGLEDMSDWKSPTEETPGSGGGGSGGSDEGDADRDGLSAKQEDENGTEAEKWDTDGDLMPDGWEALYAETDPVMPDGDSTTVGDVMAYVVTNLTVVQVGNVGDPASATNLYVVMNASASVNVGDDVSTLADLRAAYDYGGKYGLGRAVTPVGCVYAVEQSAEVVLVHGQVYEMFGFNPLTANATAFAAGTAVNTKEFTALDKYLLVRYFEELGLANEVEMNVNGTWSACTLRPGDADNDKDGVPDGWELYVMFGNQPVPATIDAAKISPFNYDDARALAPAGDMTVFAKWNGGSPAYDPWSTDSNGDGIPDEDESEWVLDEKYGEEDNDQLPNFTEYVIGVGFSNYSEFSSVAGISSTNSYSLSELVTDYFHRIGKLYLGEMFTDHDFMEDLWEDKYPVDQVTRGLYDPSRDPDDDGWSNFAECRAGTDPTLGDSYGPWSNYIRNYPVPAIHATVVMGPGGGVLNGQVVVQAYSETSLSSGLPDAIWKVTAGSSTSGTAEEKSYYLGVNPKRVYTMTLGPGSVKPGTVSIDFRDPTYVVAEGGTLTYGNMDSSQWQEGFVEDRPDPEARTGVLVAKPINGVSREVGTVDYKTGLAEIDFTLLTNNWLAADNSLVDGAATGTNAYTVIHLQESHVLVKWAANPVGGNTSAELHLTESNREDTENRMDLGHVREGKNTFVVFLDTDGGTSGKWDPGEPYGVAKDVDVGWADAEFSVELTRTTPIMARFKLASESSDSTSGGANAGSEMTDRDVINSCLGYAPNEPALYPGTNMPNTASLTRVRVVRNQVNHSSRNGNGTSYSAVLLDRYLDLSIHPTLTEADLLMEGLYDLDWGTLRRAYNPNSVSQPSLAEHLTNATYRIVIGDGVVGDSEYWGNNLPVIFSNLFEDRVYQTPTVPDPKLPQVVYSSRPTFRWSHTNSIDKAYPAFRLRIYADAEKKTTVYDSGPQRAPARDSNGMYTWTAPVYAGMVTHNGSVLAATNNYYWSVSMLDAKFTTINPDETATLFRLSASGNLNDGKEHGSIAVCVKYFGALAGSLSDVPSVRTNLVRVQAFTSPSFTGVPVGEAFVTNVSTIASDAVIATNAVIRGVPVGTYYVRAYIDTDANGQKADWESWGYACSVSDPTVKSVWTPKSVTMSYAEPVPVATVFMEDTDVDNDGFPDSWEVYTKGSLEEQGPISGNTFFAAVNPNLSSTLSAYDKVAEALSRSGTSTYPQIAQLMAVSPMVAAELLTGEGATPPEETTTVRINSFSLDDGLKLEVENTATADADSLITFTGEAQVQLSLVCAATPDFSGAVEVPIKTITISSNDTVEQVVTAEELAAARAQAPDARFFKAVIKKQ